MKERCVITPSAHPGSRSPCSAEGPWNLESDDRTRALAALRRGLDLGLTHVDTAELYGNGAVETLVGEALVGRRDEVYLVSKVLPSNASRGGTLRACERSLRRLQTDHLDLYLLHWPGAHPLAETVAAFDERVIEHAVIPWCEAHGVSVVAYSPFGSGQFPGTRSQGGRVLAEVAERHGATPYAVALAFLLRRPSVFAIPKAADVRDEIAAGVGPTSARGASVPGHQSIDGSWPSRAPRASSRPTRQPA
jgi:diketogulonate reductase-like aldo/keto reductase